MALLNKKWNDRRWWSKTTSCTYKQLENSKIDMLAMMWWQTKPHDIYVIMTWFKDLVYWKLTTHHGSHEGLQALQIYWIHPQTWIWLVHYTTMQDHARLNWDYCLTINERGSILTTTKLIANKKRFRKMNGPMATQGNNEWAAAWQWMTKWNHDKELNANGIIWHFDYPTCPTNVLANIQEPT